MSKKSLRIKRGRNFGMIAELLAIIVRNSVNKVRNRCQEPFDDTLHLAGGLIGGLPPEEPTFAFRKGHKISMRDRAVDMGHWVVEETVPQPRKVGFILPAILSRNVSLSEIMAAKMRAETSDSPAVKQHYTNGMWALPHRAVEMETQESQILERRDPDLRPQIVPGDAVALTAGVDVQTRGFWFTVWAWRPDMSSVLIDYGRLTDWDSVHALVHETCYDFEVDSPKAGQSLGIWRVGMDSGGTRTAEAVVSRTEEVYRFVRQHGAGKIFACKGASGATHTPVRATSTVCPARAYASPVACGSISWTRTTSRV